MPESMLARQMSRLRMAYATSPLKRFLDWWSHELLALLPARAREFLVERRAEILVRLDQGKLELIPDARTARASVTVDLSQDVELSRAEVNRELARSEEPPALIYVLAPSRLLRLQLTLPAAAEENLRQVLAFEMDRQTPFRAEQVYYDHRIVGRDVASKQLEVELAVLPRHAVDGEIGNLAAAGVSLDAVDGANGETAQRLGFNLLPPDRRAMRPNLWLRLNLALAAVAVLLLGVVMSQSVSNREQAAEALRAETNAMRTEAKAVAALRTTLKDAVEGANFLSGRKRSRPMVTDLIYDLTERLNDDTWLQRLSVNGDQVQIQGQSKEAASLITVLQRSPYLEKPAVQGAITPDARTGKEQFMIAAKAKLPKPAELEAAAAKAGEPEAGAPESKPRQPGTTSKAIDPAAKTAPAASAEKPDASAAQR